MIIKEEGVSSLDYSDISKKYPKSTAKLNEFTKKGLQEFQRLILEEYKKEGISEEEFSIPEIEEDVIADSIQNSFSTGSIISLYRFFDNNHINVGIIPLLGREQWSWIIVLKDSMEPINPKGERYNSRMESEIKAFNKAFEIMEGML